MKPVLYNAVLPFVTASAQTSRGTITGTVLDAWGAAVAGAHVSLTDGRYRRSALHGKQPHRPLSLGKYLDVRHPGFRRYTGHGIGVEANRVTTFDPRLQRALPEPRFYR